MAAITLARIDPGGGGAWLGNLLVLAGVLGEAAYVLLAKRLAGRVPVLTASLWMQCFSALILAPFALGDLGAASALAEPRLLALLVFHALTASVLCLLLWLFLGEQAGPVHALGFALMLGSLLLATWPPKLAHARMADDSRS
jgi:drug/metabolite transporter (DMT)-like permease